MPPQQVIIFIIGTVVILFGAYFVTYYIGMKASGQTRAGLRNRNINVRDRYSISRDKAFYVVEIAGKVYIMGVTNNGMTVMDTYMADEFAELTANSETGSNMPWSDTPVGQYGNRLTKKVVAFFAAKREERSRVSPGRTESFAESMRKAETSSASAENSSASAESNDKEDN